MKSYQGLTVIEIPDDWGSQTDVTTIIQTAAAFKDDDNLYELYHELSHQWNVKSTDPMPPRWEEGLACFLQYKTVEVLEGRTVMDGYRERLLSRLKKTYSENPACAGVPMVEFGERGMTGLSYTAGSLFFMVLHDLVGEEAFRQIIGTFYQEYVGKGATTETFARHARETANIDLAPLFDDWFFGTAYAGFITDGLTVEKMVDRYRAGRSPDQ